MILLNMYGYSFDDYMRLCEEYSRDEALNMILSPETPESEQLRDQSFLDLYQSAMDLYGLIHERYILTQKGLHKIKESEFKYNI